MLFEKRLGGKVFRPIGREWYDQGFWKVYDHPATVAQFLDIGGANPDGTPPVNEVIAKTPTLDPIYMCKDIDSGTVNRAITFNGFLKRKFDIVIASIPQHIESFARLCELHPDHPKLIYQVGNSWNIPDGSPIKNVMASAIIPFIPSGIHSITYHQEFDLDIFCPDDKPMPAQKIYSFVNCFSLQNHFARDWGIFQEIEKKMPTWVYKCFGGQCRDGCAHGSQEVADKMREARFIWHTKYGGDGYGHVFFNSTAVGRPIITNKGYYRGKLGERLMIDGETCIDIDGLSVDEIVDKIYHYSDPALYQAMCKNVYNNFKKVVDFDAEYNQLITFLENLL